MPTNTPHDHPIRHDWQIYEAQSIYRQPFNDLLYQAHSLHRSYFTANAIQLSSLLSIKTGGCAEDCAYCPQSAHHDSSHRKSTELLDTEAVLQAAVHARASGASRFCMGAAWRNPKDRDFPALIELVSAVKGLGLETCMTLGMLTHEQAQQLKSGGLDYYNHNLDTSPDFYRKIISTRTYQDRLDTLRNVRAAGISVCSGGILGLGESDTDRVELLLQLANLPQHPESVPLNLLVKVEGTPLADAPPLDPLDFVRTVALTRILMPRSVIRLSAGRDQMDDATHALCFFAGANSIFYGDQLLTRPNAALSRDEALFARLGLHTASNPSIAQVQADVSEETFLS